jgi:signal transduction histidine kinase
VPASSRAIASRLSIRRDSRSTSADLFRAALDALPLVLAGRPLGVTVSPDAPDALADPALAVEILTNLLENAARAGRTGAPLELAAEPHPSDRSRVRFEVRDRGPGASAEVKRTAASGAFPGETGGAGLGLVISASLTRALGGSLALLDRPGGGTIARLDLPAALETTS